jgi:cytoskeletal protein CcmA (bactofilin family)
MAMMEASEMREERGTIYGDLTVEDDLVLRSMVTGNVIVADGAHLELRGLIGGALRVDAGGVAAVHGTVSGPIVNAGSVEVWGMVHGSIEDVGGRLLLHPGCFVGGREVR